MASRDILNDLDFKSSSRVRNLLDAVDGQEPATYAQLLAAVGSTPASFQIDDGTDVAEVEATTRAIRMTRRPMRAADDGYVVNSYAIALSSSSSLANSVATDFRLLTLAWLWHGCCEIKTVRVWFGQNAITGARAAGPASLELFQNRFTASTGANVQLYPPSNSGGSRGRGLPVHIEPKAPSALLYVNQESLSTQPDSFTEAFPLASIGIHAPIGVENIRQGDYLWDHLADGGPIRMDTYQTVYATLDYPAAATSNGLCWSLQVTWDEIVPTFNGG
jgi:hypothetical protein